MEKYQLKKYRDAVKYILVFMAATILLTISAYYFPSSRAALASTVLIKWLAAAMSAFVALVRLNWPVIALIALVPGLRGIRYGFLRLIFGALLFISCLAAVWTLELAELGFSWEYYLSPDSVLMLSYAFIIADWRLYDWLSKKTAEENFWLI